ncbi:hypothetical protein AB1E18_015034 [Capra hircus]
MARSELSATTRSRTQEEGGTPSRTWKDSAPSGTREESAPSGTREDSTPSGIQEESAPSGTREESAPRGTREESARSGTQEESAPRGTREDSAPSGTQEESAPRGTREDSAPSGTREGSAPRGTREDSAPSGTREGSAPSGTREGSAPRGTREESARSGTQEESAPRGTREDSAPSGTREGSAPRGTREGSAPSGTREGSAPRGTREDSAPSGTQEESAPRGTREDSAPSGTREGSAPRTHRAALALRTPATRTERLLKPPSRRATLVQASGEAQASILLRPKRPSISDVPTCTDGVRASTTQRGAPVTCPGPGAYGGQGLHSDSASVGNLCDLSNMRPTSFRGSRVDGGGCAYPPCPGNGRGVEALADSPLRTRSEPRLQVRAPDTRWRRRAERAAGPRFLSSIHAGPLTHPTDGPAAQAQRSEAAPALLSRTLFQRPPRT